MLEDFPSGTTAYTDVAKNLKRFLDDAGFGELLIFCEGKCRLSQPSHEIYFSPTLFKGWLYEDRLRLLRKSMRLAGLCKWEETVRDFQLTVATTDNLKKLNNGGLKNDAHDLLKNSPVIDDVRSLRLRTLYTSIGGEYKITVPLIDNTKP
ncbi:hypothetical protein FACS1894204_01150 [Synergistales bacterium]|nr:hypothetical protein FACS1894204_01150 [Synergistales bacterium]